jgi:hypothetical protein
VFSSADRQHARRACAGTLDTVWRYADRGLQRGRIVNPVQLATQLTGKDAEIEKLKKELAEAKKP